MLAAEVEVRIAGELAGDDLAVGGDGVRELGGDDVATGSATHRVAFRVVLRDEAVASGSTEQDIAPCAAGEQIRPGPSIEPVVAVEPTAKLSGSTCVWCWLRKSR